MNLNICSRVNSEQGIKIDDNHVLDVLLNKKSMLSESVKSLIKHSAEQHANEILNTLRESGIELRASPAIFIGGGSQILKGQILSSSLIDPEFVEFIPDVSANATGYTTLATVILKQKKAQNANG
jgi:plasmid segregation protein ParM